MRQAVTLAVSMLVFASPAVMSVAQVHDNISSQSQVRQLQYDLVNAYLHSNVALLDRVLADDYTFTDDAGNLVDKQHTLESFRSGERHIASYNMSEERVRVYGTAAVMTYRYVSEETYKGRDDSGEYRITRVFARKNGGWQIVAGHESRISSHK